MSKDTRYIPHGTYIAQPTSAQSSGVLVLHAWWGLTASVQSTCDQLAQAGFVAVAPDLYNGIIATTVDTAQELRATMKRPQAQQLILQATSALQNHPTVTSTRVGVVGFSLGAHYAL